MNGENLAMLYQGALTAAVRIQAKRQQIGHADAFRRRMKDVLAEIEREAIRRNYTREHTSEANFALVAFLDEVILTSDDSCRGAWAQRPLQEEIFGISVAGESFFGHIESLESRPESPHIADVLEVYYLCLLLGFQGRYAAGGRAERQLFMDRIRQRLERIRGVRREIAPGGQLPEEAIAAANRDPWLSRLRRAAVVAVGGAAASFAVFSGHLFWRSHAVNEILKRSIAP